MSIAQCWCGAMYRTSADLVEHWRAIVAAGASLMAHEKGEPRSLPSREGAYVHHIQKRFVR